MAATNTGRLASSDPNLQNIPIKTEDGREIRKAFIAEGSNVLISADYNQVEMRILADLADVKELKKAGLRLLLHSMNGADEDAVYQTLDNGKWAVKIPKKGEKKNTKKRYHNHTLIPPKSLVEGGQHKQGSET